MTTMSLTEFSCLREAEFRLAPVNIIIGPQGSGKSVTTKLFYFLTDILSGYLQYAERGDSIDEYKRILTKQFCIWFPPSAWGQGRFNINYSAGNFTVRLLRRVSKGKPSDEVALTFSDWFTSFYKQTSESFEKSRSGSDSEIEANAQVNDALDRSWRVRDVVSRKMAAEIGSSYISQQTFIPAGRAFFTSIGRLVAGFEQAGSLDPVTIKFARLLASLRDRNSRPFARESRLGVEFLQRRNAFMKQLFGGEIKFEADAEYVEANDGRKIPFTSLSSGQQELLPMWSLINYFNELDALRITNGSRVSPRARRDLVYIEEPEAHLFPSAQSLLMEFLIGSVASEKSRRSLIITTHSPYIMGKLNVFLKAGQLSRRKKRNSDLNEIVPRDCWVQESQLSALAIMEGRIVSLLDEDGLIDGRYLDNVSEDISREFSSLLQLESEM